MSRAQPALPLDPVLSSATVAATDRLRELRLATGRWCLHQIPIEDWHLAMTAWGCAAATLLKAGGAEILADLVADPVFDAKPSAPKLTPNWSPSTEQPFMCEAEELDMGKDIGRRQALDIQIEALTAQINELEARRSGLDLERNGLDVDEGGFHIGEPLDDPPLAELALVPIEAERNCCLCGWPLTCRPEYARGCCDGCAP